MSREHKKTELNGGNDSVGLKRNETGAQPILSQEALRQGKRRPAVASDTATDVPLKCVRTQVLYISASICIHMLPSIVVDVAQVCVRAFSTAEVTILQRTLVL